MSQTAPEFAVTISIHSSNVAHYFGKRAANMEHLKHRAREANITAKLCQTPETSDAGLLIAGKTKESVVSFLEKMASSRGAREDPLKFVPGEFERMQMLQFSEEEIKNAPRPKPFHDSSVQNAIFERQPFKATFPLDCEDFDYTSMYFGTHCVNMRRLEASANSAGVVAHIKNSTMYLGSESESQLKLFLERMARSTGGEEDEDAPLAFAPPVIHMHRMLDLFHTIEEKTVVMDEAKALTKASRKARRVQRKAQEKAAQDAAHVQAKREKAEREEEARIQAELDAKKAEEDAIMKANLEKKMAAQREIDDKYPLIATIPIHSSKLPWYRTDLNRLQQAAEKVEAFVALHDDQLIVRARTQDALYAFLARIESSRGRKDDPLGFKPHTTEKQVILDHLPGARPSPPSRDSSNHVVERNDVIDEVPAKAASVTKAAQPSVSTTDTPTPLFPLEVQRAALREQFQRKNAGKCLWFLDFSIREVS